MKLASHEIKVNWPIVSAWWSGLWGGLLIGLFAGPWFARSRWMEMPLALLIPPSFLLMAVLPRTILQFKEGIQRFRAAVSRFYVHFFFRVR